MKSKNFRFLINLSGIFLTIIIFFISVSTANAAWVNCASEGGYCSFSGTKTVRYGANGFYKNGSYYGGVACTNDVFGDPISGTAKTCDYDDGGAAGGGGGTPGSECATEGGTCNFSGTLEISYGANGIFYKKTATNSIACTNAAFGGDPVPNVAKKCYLGSAPASGGGGGTTTPGWTFCANENGSCTFSGTRQVRFGANSSYLYANYSNSVNCTIGQFGADPAPGVVKSCDYSNTVSANATADVTASTTQSGSYSNGPLSVSYGSAVYLKWSSTIASSCSMSPSISGGGISTQDTTGFLVGNLTTNTTYTLTCGTASDSVTINVGPANTTPTVTTSSISSIGQTTAVGGGNVTSNGGATVTVGGIAWSTSPNPTTANSKTTNSNWASYSTWADNITGLTAGTTYHVRAYATNSVGTAYGSDVTFTTSAPNTSPTVTTSSVSNVGQTTATSGGNVTSNGGATVTVSGIVWSTSANPTTANSKTTNGWAIGGPWGSDMTNLSTSTTYHVRAYATNSVGTSYGSDVTFTTGAPSAAPTATDQAATSVTTTTATLNGNITSLGVPASISQRGMCFGTTPAPTACTAVSGTTTGAFTQSKTGLTPGTTYYYRSYAINATGTGYSTGGSFTTSANLPTVTTNSLITGVTTTSAIGAGNVTSNGGATVTLSGLVWSTSANPTTANSKTTNGWAIGGPWASDMTGLTAGTIYHVRAYATNSVGTSYGSDVTFVTATPNIVNLTASKTIAGTYSDGPLSVRYSSPVYLKWSSSGATSCSISPTIAGATIGLQGTAGLSTGSITATKTYTLTCGTATDTVTLNVPTIQISP